MHTYRLIRSRRRSVAVLITPEAQLLIRAPLQFPVEKIEELLRQKSTWIEQHLQRIRKNGGPRKVKQYQEGERFNYKGKIFTLHFSSIKKATLRDDVLLLPTQKRLQAKKLVHEWYKREAREYLFSRIQEWSERTGLKYKKLRLSSAKTRWGSCSLGGNIALSWRLILLPSEAIDYVLVHELAHLLEHNHSKKFWQRVASILPNYQLQKQWFRQNRHLDTL
ncbi:MAG: M48 family metallopeptidase [Candidatus Nomurabacteria bacterium]|nr:MAG: M48 family metallopeptidase [Candidatus Nomurabacteria bacterium]